MSSPSTSRSRRRIGRVLASTGAAAAVVLLTALPASAHVTVSSEDAAPGGFGSMVFRVPTESDTASTTALTVQLPPSAPFGTVLAKPVAGWTVTTTERTLAKPVKDDDGFNLSKVVGTVTWKADRGQGIKPGEFDEFELSVGPFPTGRSSLAVPVVQTYSDGTVVTWDQPTPASGDEPEHPTPVLSLTGATHEHGSGPSTNLSTSLSTRLSASSSKAASGGGSDPLARWLGGTGVVLGLVAVGVAVTRRRRA